MVDLAARKPIRIISYNISINWLIAMRDQTSGVFKVFY